MAADSVETRLRSRRCSDCRLSDLGCLDTGVNRITNPCRSTHDDRGSETGPMHKARQDLAVCGPGEVRARFAQPNPLKHDGTDREALPDQIIQRDTTGDDIPPKRLGLQPAGGIAVEGIDTLEFNERHFVRGLLRSR